jgi:hypothetical protein
MIKKSFNSRCKLMKVEVMSKDMGAKKNGVNMVFPLTSKN